MSKAQEKSRSDFESWMMNSGRAKDWEFTIGDDQEYIYSHVAEDFSVWCAAVASMSPASSEQQAAPRVQWWLATIDMHGNPTLTDGAHGDRVGADRAAYLIDALGVGQGKNYAVARVELSEPKPNADGVNQEAVAQSIAAARASNGGKA